MEMSDAWDKPGLFRKFELFWKTLNFDRQQAFCGKGISDSMYPADV